MAINYPASLDNGTSLPNPTATQDTNSPSLSAGQGLQNDAVIALETKLGTGASTPSGTYALVSTGTGSSAWSLATPSGTIVGTSDTQTLTNKTIDASSNTISNLSGSDLASGTITATQIANATITGTQLASNLSLSGTLATGGFIIGHLPVWQYLGSASITTSFSTSTTGSFVDVTGLSVTVTVPTGATKVRITAPIMISNTTATYAGAAIFESTTNLFQYAASAPNRFSPTLVALISSPTSGSHTYKISVASNGGTTYVRGTDNTGYGNDGGPSSIQVECC